MAYTKIWSVKTRLDTSIRYIENPEKTKFMLNIGAAKNIENYIVNDDKTEKGLFVKTFNCGKDKAYERMIKTQIKFGKNKRKNGVLAYHIIQSFQKNETTPEIAHKCGIELIEKLFADKYEVVLATHLDKQHLHNHILVNAVSFKSGLKYRNSYKDYFGDIRGVSDEICKSNSLSVIEPKGKGLNYIEWQAAAKGKTTIRGQIREEIDQIILSSRSMQDFWKIFRERGNKIHRQGENITHVSFVPAFGTKPIRFSSLGEGYTLEDIQSRISAQRNGIRISVPQIHNNYNRKKFKNKNYKPKKIKGFTALYFHYMYFFHLIRKKQAPQKLSFFLRDELIKFERYQKQFRFLYKNNIETEAELENYRKSKEETISELTEERKRLYASRTEGNESQIKQEADKINAELKALRADVRMCKAISKDAYRISEKQKQADALIEQEKKELKENEHNRIVR